MAVSAFKSTSKRGNIAAASTASSSAKENGSEDVRKKVPPRRSRSVTAATRSYPELSIAPSSSSTTDFVNKRDNPLFSKSSSSSPEGVRSENPVRISKFDDALSRFDESAPKSAASSTSDGRRGRSVSRSSDYSNPIDGSRRQVGRSLSRVDTGRRRSLSRGPHRHSESEAAYDCSVASSSRNKNKNDLAANGQRKNGLAENTSELPKQSKSLQTWSSKHPLLEPSDSALPCKPGPNWEGRVSSTSQAHVEEKTIRSVFEQMKAFQSDNPTGGAGAGARDIYETVRSEVRLAVSEIRQDLENAIRGRSSAILSATDVADMPPELVNPNALELVSDIRREYATKLEQSHERARKLRTDLAIEEQRGQELDRILRDVLPDPKTSEAQGSWPRRRTTIERRKMSNSKRLMEEAMNYFDECVSISTFDSTDFSATEEPPQDELTPSCATNRGSSGSTSSHFHGHLWSNKESQSQSETSFIHDHSDITGSTSGSDIFTAHADRIQKNFPAPGRREGGNYVEADGTHDIRSYIKKFEKRYEIDKSELQSMKRRYNADDYRLRMSAEEMLFDRVIYKSRIEFGGLLLCGIRTL